MQPEKLQPQGEWILPETRFTEFPALSLDLGVRISRSASETDDLLFFLPIIIGKSYFYNILLQMSYGGQSERHSDFSLRRVKNVCKQLTSLLVSRVSCFKPWARQ